MFKEIKMSPYSYNLWNSKIRKKIQISKFVKIDEALCQILTQYDQWFQRRRFFKNSPSTHNGPNFKNSLKIQISKFCKAVNNLQTYASDEAIY